MDHETTPQGEERKAAFSNSGPGISVYAAGSRIISAMSQTNDSNSNNPYFLNGSFKQQLLSGTSMAAPQIAGIAALVFQMHPDWEPRQVAHFIKSRALPALYTSGQNNDYTNQHSVHGGETKIAYVPMASQRKYSFFRATV
jgi:subtilisin family serine protease